CLSRGSLATLSQPRNSGAPTTSAVGIASRQRPAKSPDRRHRDRQDRLRFRRGSFSAAPPETRRPPGTSPPARDGFGRDRKERGDGGRQETSARSGPQEQ